LAPPTQSLAPLLDMRDIRRKLGLTRAQLAKKLHGAAAILWLVSRAAARPILPRAKSLASKRVWADDLPAVALEEFLVFVGVGRAVLRERLDEAAGGSRGVEK
jgi:hypothetical protein